MFSSNLKYYFNSCFFLKRKNLILGEVFVVFDFWETMCIEKLFVENGFTLNVDYGFFIKFYLHNLIIITFSTV